MKNAIRWFLGEFLPRVLYEFVWLLFSVSFGIYLALTAAGLTLVDIDPQLSAYGRTVVMVIFNAAMLRIILYYGLSALDKALDKVLSDRAEFLKTQVKFAVTMLRKQPVTDTDTEDKAE